jgi:hypothetical protein
MRDQPETNSELLFTFQRLESRNPIKVASQLVFGRFTLATVAFKFKGLARARGQLRLVPLFL